MPTTYPKIRIEVLECFRLRRQSWALVLEGSEQNERDNTSNVVNDDYNPEFVTTIDFSRKTYPSEGGGANCKAE